MGWTTAKTMEEEEEKKGKVFQPYLFLGCVGPYHSPLSEQKEKVLRENEYLSWNILSPFRSLIYLESSALSFRNESQLKNVVPIRSSKRMRFDFLGLDNFFKLVCAKCALLFLMLVVHRD